MSTAVVSDTTAYLPEELLRRHDIHQVSLYVTLAGLQQREIEITDYEEFYDRLARSGESVTTSQPSIGDFLDVYEPLLAEGREIVSVHIAAGISGTFEAAAQAKQRLIEAGRSGERVHLVDARSAAGGLGLVLVGAARAASAGADAAETVAQAERTREELNIWFALDTLEYLRRGGRIGAAGAWIGTTLKIKPILTFAEQVTPVERVRTSSRAYARLVEHARDRKEAGVDSWVVQHIQSAEIANRLVDDCREIFQSEPAFVSEVGPVLGAHAGPGMLGFGSANLPA